MVKIIAKLIDIAGTFALVILLLLIFAGVVSWLRKGHVPQNTVLELDLDRRVVEHIPENPMAKIFLGNVLQMRDITSTLERAAADDRVAGLL